MPENKTADMLAMMKVIRPDKEQDEINQDLIDKEILLEYTEFEMGVNIYNLLDLGCTVEHITETFNKLLKEKINERHTS